MKPVGCQSSGASQGLDFSKWGLQQHCVQIPMIFGLKLVPYCFSEIIQDSLIFQLFVAINERETASLCISKISHCMASQAHSWFWLICLCRLGAASRCWPAGSREPSHRIKAVKFLIWLAALRIQFRSLGRGRRLFPFSVAIVKKMNKSFHPSPQVVTVLD